MQLDKQLEALGQCIPLPRYVLPVSRSGSPPKFNYFFQWPIANLPWKFMQIHLEVFVQSC